MDYDSLYVTLGGHHFSFYYDTTFTQFGWTHVAAAWDGDTIKTYVNGYFLGQAEYTGSISWNHHKVFLGKSDASMGYLSGALDEVRIYNRALDGNEIMALKNYADTTKFVSLISPNGGEKLLAGQKQFITWVSNQVNNIGLDYSTNNGTNWLPVVSSVDAAAGKYIWSIPGILSDSCKLRIRDMADSTFHALSDSLFSIIDTVAYVNITALLEAFYNEYTGLMVPDMVYVSLRAPSNPDSIADYASTYLDSSGHGTASFLHITSGRYYIVINHRNHVETWSAATYQVTRGDTLALDFSASRSIAYGNNLVRHNNRWCIYAGDVNQDGYVDPLDLAAVDLASWYYVSGYVPEDVNGDGYVDPLDFSMVDINSYSYVEIKRPPAVLGRRAVKQKWDFHTATRTTIPIAKKKEGK
jgi:hypothetical protein